MFWSVGQKVQFKLKCELKDQKDQVNDILSINKIQYRLFLIRKSRFHAV